MKNSIFRLVKVKFTCLIILTLLLTMSCENQKEELTEFRKPNIIFILADDLGYGDLSLTGQQNFETPNIDNLAKEGIFFTRHYSGSTVCAPSRSTLMTGLHTGHTFIRGNKEVKPEGQHPIDSSVVTVAKLLKDNGYVTGAFGKWGLGYPGSEGDPNNQGFDEFYGYNCQRAGHNYYPYHLWHNQTKEMLDGNKGRQTGQYAPILIHEKALSFIEQNKDKSFFLYYPSIIPHAELFAPEEYMKKYRGKFSQEKAYIGTDEGEAYKNGGYGSQEEPLAAFAAMISLLDDQVGEIRNKLEELGIAENTVIFFTSDNGPHQEGGADPDFFNSNGNFKGYKRDLYEGGIHLPLIVEWPGKIEANKISNHVSAFWDFLPTACDIAGIQPPEKIDGISFLPELLGKEQLKHNSLYWEFHEQGGKQAVRLEDWKGIRLDMSDNPDAPIELYNLTVDESEENNVADKNPGIVNQIKEIMDKQHEPSKDFPFLYEKELIK